MFAVVVSLVAVLLLRDQPYFSAFPRQFYCNLADGAVTRGTFAGPMLAVAISSILFSSFSSTVCWKGVLGGRVTALVFFCCLALFFSLELNVLIHCMLDELQ